MSWIRFTIDSELGSVGLIGQSVSRICESLRFDETQAYKVELSVVEAVTNCIRHAYGEKAGHAVSVRLWITESKLGVEVSDTGSSMPAKQVEKLRCGSNVLRFDETDLACVPVGGMGLQLIHECMDQVDYKSDGGTNTLYMTMHRPLPSNS